MNVLALLEDPHGPSARLRFEPFARRLEQEGHAIRRVAIPRSGPARWRLLASARDFDAVWLQRRLLQPFESAWLRARARRLVVDVDDALWRRDRPPFDSWTRRLRVRALLRRADVVLAGSRTLREELRSLGIDAEVLGTPVEAMALRARAPSSARPPTLVWIGQPSTWRYVRALAGAWARIRSARPSTRFVAVGSGVVDEPLLPGVEHHGWSATAEAEALAAAEVGLAPLADDPWTRGKCGARVLACLAAGLPVVASAVGAQRELAEEVGGVVLASDPDDFAPRVLDLLEDPGRRERLVDEARAALAGSRTVDALLPSFRAHLLGGTTDSRIPSFAPGRTAGPAPPLVPDPSRVARGGGGR
jgi:glycosyltransferase involved in cell wall biosynthesis